MTACARRFEIGIKLLFAAHGIPTSGPRKFVVLCSRAPSANVRLARKSHNTLVHVNEQFLSMYSYEFGGNPVLTIVSVAEDSSPIP